ncbi:MAG: hypothetical protein Q8911_13615 [Bacillota bacterium]|nr:hypothetical protein [Bacillota bacterium]
MNRTEVLRQQREKVLIYLAENKENRAKWLTALMDIDDEMEEIEKMGLKHIDRKIKWS